MGEKAMDVKGNVEREMQYKCINNNNNNNKDFN